MTAFAVMTEMGVLGPCPFSNVIPAQAGSHASRPQSERAQRRRRGHVSAEQ